MNKTLDQLLDGLNTKSKISLENAFKEFELIRAKVQNIHTPMIKEERTLAERTIHCIQAGKIVYNKECQSIQYFFDPPIKLVGEEIKSVHFKHITRATLKSADVNFSNLINGYNEKEIEKSILAFTGKTSEFLDNLNTQQYSDLVVIVQLFLV